MKIVLIRPSFGSYFQITPPLSLGYLSSSLKKAGFADIELIDASLGKMSPQEVAGLINKKNPGIIGVQVYTGSQNWVKELTNVIKANKVKAPIIAGGPHVSSLEELALEYMGVNFGILGEGEESIVKFAGYIQGKNAIEEVDGLVYRQKVGWKSAKKKYGFVKDLNLVPLPDWDLLNPENYFHYMKSVSLPLKGAKPAPIITSRGCPYRCTFCCSGTISRHIIRYRSPENVIFEIKYLNQKYGVNEIFFSDDNLTLDSRRAETIFDLLTKEKLNINWRAPNGLRIDSLNEFLVGKMEKSGGYFVGLGIETGSEQMMKKIKKRVDLKKVKEKVNLLHKYKIKTSGFFMCGLPGETKKEIQKSIDFAKSVPFDRIQVCNFVPYPGSEDFDRIFKKTEQKMYQRNVLKFQQNGFVPAFQSLGLNETYKMQRKFYTNFYFRPKIIIQLIKSFKVSQLLTLLKHPFLENWLSLEEEWYDE